MTKRMSRRKFMGAGATTALLGRPSGGRGAARPNILHIMVDQMQWGAIAGRSECRTPHINRLAEQGILFERSYTPSPLCCPARAMLCTGAYHWHNGVYNQVHVAPSMSRDMFPNIVTYSERLKEAGYRQGYIGKWHASRLRTPTDFGYDEVGSLAPVENGRYRLKAHYSRWFRWPGTQPFPMWGYVEGPEEGTYQHRLADAAIGMMKEYAAGPQPWHLEVHFPQPHDAYMPLKKYLNRYDPAKIPVPESFGDTFEGKPGLHRRESETWGKVSEDDYRQGRAHYYAYCEQLDPQIGRILDGLEQTGQAANTLVTFSCDHGDMVGAHRMWIKGWMPYEECYRIPMVMRWPARIRPRLVSNRLVQLHDLAHTYVDAAGALPLPHPDGRSLLALAENPENADWPEHILCAFYGGEFLYTQRIAITDRYKYVFNGFDIDELYDLEKDPQELRNRVADPSYREVADDMRARLYELMSRYGDPYGDTGYQLPAPPGVELRQEHVRYYAPRYLPRGRRIEMKA